jgi:alcohol dehydrogenase YqhD (iron-dependent ADH family)
MSSRRLTSKTFACRKERPGIAVAGIPNPRRVDDELRQAVAIGHDHTIEFLLAGGGNGSTIHPVRARSARWS